MSFLNKSFDKVTRGFAQKFFPTEEASYVLRIDSATTFMVKKKEVVKIAVTILQADAGSFRPGTEACVWWDDGNPEGGEEMLARNVKTFLCEVTGKADSEITGAEAAAALREGSDLEGVILRLNTIVREKKKTKGEFYNVYQFSQPFGQEDVDALSPEARALLA